MFIKFSVLDSSLSNVPLNPGSMSNTSTRPSSEPSSAVPLPPAPLGPGDDHQTKKARKSEVALPSSSSEDEEGDWVVCLFLF